MFEFNEERKKKILNNSSLTLTLPGGRMPGTGLAITHCRNAKPEPEASSPPRAEFPNGAAAWWSLSWPVIRRYWRKRSKTGLQGARPRSGAGTARLPPCIDTIRCEWCLRRSRSWNGGVVPGAEALLNALRSYTAILPPVKVAEDFVHLQGLSREEQEKRLRDLVERGQTIAAIYIARRIYSYDLNQARIFVDGLCGGKERAANT